MCDTWQIIITLSFELIFFVKHNGDEAHTVTAFIGQNT